MPKINVEYLAIKPATADAGFLLDTKSVDLSIKANDAKYYTDGVKSEEDKSFSSGTIKTVVGTLPVDSYCAMFGHTKDSETEEITCSGNDVCAICGTGFIGTSVKSGTRSYRAIWLPNTIYAEPSDTYKCKEGTLSYQDGGSLEGSIDLDSSGYWKKEKTFTTLADAKTWIDTKASITSSNTESNTESDPEEEQSSEAGG